MKKTITIVTLPAVGMAQTAIVVTALALATSGCSTMVAYSGKANAPLQTLKYTQGVGSVVEKDEVHEIFMYPTFKMQGTTMTTFTIGYANNAAEPVNFTTNNVKAFFRGQPVPIYSYTERIAEIQREKTSKQIALAIVGGLAAGAAAYGASHQTYTSNYHGYVAGRGGVTAFSGANTVRVYDPFAGLVAGAAVGAATGVGVQQIEYNARNQEQAANSILQANTVDPLHMVSGELILKGCCDPYPEPNDVIRFEVTANGKTSVFEFERTKVSAR
ncbi:hypothetical protein QTI04_30495 [Variovorax sp. J22R115]|nr:hypothetical protein [Variovorax sp. J22R115]